MALPQASNLRGLDARVEVPGVLAADVATLQEGSRADRSGSSAVDELGRVGRVLRRSRGRLRSDGDGEHRVQSHRSGRDGDGADLVASGRGSRRGSVRGRGRDNLLSAVTGNGRVAGGIVALDVNLELVLDLVLDGDGVVVGLLREVEGGQRVSLLLVGGRGRGSVGALDEGLSLDLDGGAARVDLSGRDIIRGDGTLVALEVGGEVGELAILGVGDGRGLQSRPGPDPVESVLGVLGNILGELDSRLAPDIGPHGLGSLVRELGLTVGGDGLAVDLVALAIVVVAGSQELATGVTTLAISSPLAMNVEEGVVGSGVSGAIDEDSTAVQRLVGGVLRLGDVTVLLVAEGDIVAGSSGQVRELSVLGALKVLLAKIEALVGDAVGEGLVVEGGITTVPAVRKASRADKSAIGSDTVELLNPGVGAGKLRRAQQAGNDESKSVTARHCEICDVGVSGVRRKVRG